MKKLPAITIFYLLLLIPQAWSLPPCEGDESKWDNCEGSLTSSSGRIYIGVFKDRIFEGKNDKNVKYIGEYEDGTQNGQGTYNFPDGAKYVGKIKDGARNGQGTWTHPDGFKYVGEWKDDLRNGQGTWTQPDGFKYVGEFKNNKRHGQGTYTFADGEKYVGEWKDGEMKHTKMVTKNLPKQQLFLIDFTNKTLAKIKSGYNDAKIKLVWIKASKELCSSKTFDAYGIKTNFIGHVKKIYANDSGSMGIEIILSDDGKLDKQYKVKQYVVNESLHEIILELNEGSVFSEGDKVKFTGYFLKGKTSQNECLSTTTPSLDATDLLNDVLDFGMDASPDFEGRTFKFKFTNIEKI